MGQKRTAIMAQALEKCPSGIAGLDEITYGGLPRGRPTLVAGGAGCGKTLLAMEFLYRGITQFNEPGAFFSFEEKIGDLVTNFASLNFDLSKLMDENRLAMDFVYIERSEIEETGIYDLEGLFIRLGHAIDTVGAKRVVLDTVEALFTGLQNEAILRSELRRMFRWLKDRGVTAVITGERGAQTLTRYGLEEYVADCVIVLDNRMRDQIATRRLRVLKYRGSSHGANEFPFLISDRGIVVMPITSNLLQHQVSTEHISSGVAGLDRMLSAKGFYRGSTILISGTAGTAKTSFACFFAAAACQRNEGCLYYAFEESPEQIFRNMRSVGLDLKPFLEQGLLRIVATRPTYHGLEMHLATIQHQIQEFEPACVVIDPISNFASVGVLLDVTAMMARLVDFLKSRQITALMTNLTTGKEQEQTEVGISSLVDTWILLQSAPTAVERVRTLTVLKSRGMNHSAQVKPFMITDQGIVIED